MKEPIPGLPGGTMERRVQTNSGQPGQSGHYFNSYIAPSLSDLARVALDPDLVKGQVRPDIYKALMEHKRRRQSEQDFYGCDNETAMDVLMNGYEGAQEKVNNLGSILQKKIETAPFLQALVPDQSRRIVWSDEGMELEFGRYYAGRLETSWRKNVPRRKLGRGRAARIFVNICRAWHNGKDVFERTGSMAVAVADFLDQCGFSTTIDAYSITTSFEPSGAYTAVSYPIKSYGEPIDVERLMGALGTPAGFRVATFTGMILACEERSQYGSLGCVRNLGNCVGDARMLFDVDPEDSVILLDELVGDRKGEAEIAISALKQDSFLAETAAA